MASTFDAHIKNSIYEDKISPGILFKIEGNLLTRGIFLTLILAFAPTESRIQDPRSVMMETLLVIDFNMCMYS
jgi:hypothetical protein